MSTTQTQYRAIQTLLKTYIASTPQHLKLIDAYMVYILLTGIFQFIYVILVGTYPYNAFLGGFISTVGSFVLAGKDEVLREREKSVHRVFFSYISFLSFSV